MNAPLFLMKHFNSGIIFIFLLLFPLFTEAQIPSQTVRGQVINSASGSPIPGVNVILADHQPLTGTTTDADGFFRLSGVPVGRHTIRFSFIGFETQIIRDVLVASARETVLDVSLRESVSEMEALIVTPDMSKDQPINMMAVSSARLLSMEEASRYAGGFDDPARLASSFAGVAGNLSDNAIVIRGNAPKGLLWQMEGVEIPTPSHFANILTFGGGGITALSSQMISNSDFYTGAFPAEFGNALSGVFDLNIRNGNIQRHEHTVKIGAIGLDLASEGPLTGSGSSSYLVNYRYSTFSLIAPLLPEDAGGVRYQNLSFKFNLPAFKGGTFSLWGIGATDRSGQSAGDTPGSWVYNNDREEIYSPTRFGAAGLRHRANLGSQAFLTTSFAASGNGLRWEISRFTDDANLLYPREYVNYNSGKLTAKSVLNYRFGVRHSNRSGITVNRLGYNQMIRYSEDPEVPLQTLTNEQGHRYLVQAFSQSRLIFDRMILTGGVYVQYFDLTGSGSAEPRLGFQYRERRNLYSVAYGRHSQLEPLSVYFSHPENRMLETAKADHIVAGFSRMLNPDFQIKAEAYYQYLSNVPVNDGTSFSVLNLELDWFINDPLINKGAGKNYGLELTLERYLSRGWHGLLTGSLFQSKYRGGDGIWRNTRFNRGYTMVLLGGREWEFRREDKVRFLSINGRLNFMGGKRMTPVDLHKSFEQRDIIYDESRAYSEREPAVFYSDFTIEYRTYRRNRSDVWSLQIINLTGYKEFNGYRFNLRNGSIDEEREMILIPNLSYKIDF
jgi:hypothetical protein